MTDQLTWLNVSCLLLRKRLSNELVWLAESKGKTKVIMISSDEENDAEGSIL
jgi:hypothetical protein